MQRITRVSRLTLAIALLVATASLGCAFGEINPRDPMKRQHSLNDAQKYYTDLVRWGEFDRAAAMVDPEKRAAYLEAMPDKKAIRFTDYEAGAIQIDDETGESTVVVTYTAYGVFMPIVVEIEETQHWYRESFGNDWRVRSTFAGLEALQ